VVMVVVGVGTYLVVGVRVVVVDDGGERVEGSELGLWRFVSHMYCRRNISPK